MRAMPMQVHVGQGVAMALEDAFLLSRLLSGPLTDSALIEGIQ
jgi:2-polyprenyl-6-methoxyphenol hydroxylase-like FAD-dependent oxidoreductase